MKKGEPVNSCAETSSFVRPKEVAACMNCSESMAHVIIRKLNSELQSKGYITVAGRVSRAYFEERCYVTNPKA